MVDLEAEIEQTLDRLSEQAADHHDVAALLTGFSKMSGAQRQTLETRLKAIAGDVLLPNRVVARFEVEGSDYPVSAALQHASATLNHAIIGYAMLRSIALRFRDSSLIGEGNTGDIAERHTKNYVGAVHRIHQILHNVVLWEMDKEGITCLCTCPCCGLGVCLCAQGPRKTLSDAWSKLGPISDETEVFLHPPRPDSAAANASLRHGDVIVAVDGQKLESHFTLQGVVEGHESGDAIELRVRRRSGELEEIAVTRP